MNDNTNRPWEKVTDQSYFRQVMGNMGPLGVGARNPMVACIRFGNTGDGHAPNYQIEALNGTKHCFKGMGHEIAPEAGDEFEPTNLSVEQFTYKDVQDMLARLRR